MPRSKTPPIDQTRLEAFKDQPFANTTGDAVPLESRQFRFKASPFAARAQRPPQCGRLARASVSIAANTAYSAVAQGTDCVSAT